MSKIIAGWINLDKPASMTSAGALNRMKRIINVKKLGHAGTLDPMATGVLPVAVGNATKLIQYAQNTDKEYEFTVRWGVETNTLDAEGDIIKTSDKIPTEAEIKAVLPEFIGTIMQMPPIFSALKVDGKRAYDLARSGEEVELKPREVKCHSLEIIHTAESAYPCCAFRVTSGKGFYVRSLARDIAVKIGTYGSVWALRRTKVGKFDSSNIISLDKLEKLMYSGASLRETLLPPQLVLDDIPALRVDRRSAFAILNGRNIDISWIKGAQPEVAEVAVFFEGKLIAMGAIAAFKLSPVNIFANIKDFMEEKDVDYQRTQSRSD